jgi:putative methyltransferase
MKKLLLVQPNFKIGIGSLQGYWLPYSVGCLWSYAKQFNFVTENFELVDIIFRRERIETLVARLDHLDVCFLSCYMWNWEYNKALAQSIKAKFPHCKIVMGGPQITDSPNDSFFRNYNYIDTICLTEGEETFVKILETVLDERPLLRTYQSARLNNLDIPSPYLSGVFDDILANNPDYVFNATLETNRGCPFACTFCDWGSLTYAKIRKFNLEKVFAELAWMAKNKMDYVTIADANFGVFYERDMLITDRLIELQIEYGYPKVVDATWYKNSSEKILKIVKKFTSSGFNRGLTLSVQSMDDKVLTEIKRRNMEISNLKDIFDQCNKQGILSYTELILGLPQETYDTWANGLCNVIQAGQHGAIESWLTQLLENAELNKPEQRQKHGLKTVIANGYVSGHEEEDEINENAELVVGTKYMPFDKLIDSWLYSWMINNFHCFGWTQVYTRYANSKGTSYRSMYDELLKAIKTDTGMIGNLYKQAKMNITYYLTHGQALNFDGHTQLWDAQKVFHVKHNQVLDFVDSVFTANYLDVDQELWHELQKYQHVFTTDPYTEYPYKVEIKYNLEEFLKGNKLTRTPVTYTIDIKEHNLPHDEYISRLYYRRRQGWGKSIIGVSNERRTTIRSI